MFIAVSAISVYTTVSPPVTSILVRELLFTKSYAFMYLFMFISYFTFHAFSKITGEGVYFSPVLDNSVLSTFKKSITMRLKSFLNMEAVFMNLKSCKDKSLM